MNHLLSKRLMLAAVLVSLSGIASAMSSEPAKPDPAIDPSPTALNCGTEAAKAECLTPKKSDEYYIDQSIKYFLTMDSSVSIFVQPNYSDNVIRWEWPPWLYLTGYGRNSLIITDILLKAYPTGYSMIDCQAFDTQPFGRCHVVFDYNGKPCPIYEEFTFNDQGEITFIEAWSDYPSLLPMDADDYWAEGDNVKRLANKVPGLGNANGKIDDDATWMTEASKRDEDLDNLVTRLHRPVQTYVAELVYHVNDLAKGCEPPQ